MPGATVRSQSCKATKTCCVLNTGPVDAQVTLTLYFEDREPQGPYRFTVPARRTCHKRFNDLESPAKVPLGVGFSCVIESDVPVVVQHTRLDSRQAENSIMTTIAYPL
ncbi:sensory rhodopsin transducer [Stenotrophomonas nematodicola]|uniref:Sensory rhodopsin transducer n=1 Tax=Stenotrophomonas nematodicola TaxID=2656746 RepID=A0ABW7CXS3_9GAMM